MHYILSETDPGGFLLILIEKENVYSNPAYAKFFSMSQTCIFWPSESLVV